MRKIKNPFVGKDGYNCFGCSPDNPFGLHMEFLEDGDDVISYWHPHDHFQGWTGVMHGGILATMIDETAGWVVMRKLQTSGMTSRMNLKYLAPVMLDEPQITVRARITGQKRNYWIISVSLEDGKGKTCVEAEVVYYAFDKEHSKEMGFFGCDVEEEQLLSM